MYLTRTKRYRLLAIAALLIILLSSGMQGAIAKTIYLPAAAQGWIDIVVGKSFTSNISGTCSKAINVDFYGTGLHTCTANGHIVVWGYACPNGSEHVSIATPSTPYGNDWVTAEGLDPTIYAADYGIDMSGSVIVVPLSSHPYGSNVNDNVDGKCKKDQLDTLKLDLSGPTDSMPEMGQSVAPIMWTARVSNKGVPESLVPLSFTVAVSTNSGGHEHHDSNRPKGNLDAIKGTTDTNGEFKFIFKAPEVAGVHTITATCSTCTNKSISRDIEVKVPNLLPISPNPPQNTDGTFVYALTSVDKTHAGNGRYHHNQYFLTDQSSQNLLALIKEFAIEGWGTVALNDASLLWGGRYDITGNWGGPHAGHREGREIDISFARAKNPVSQSKQKSFYKKFCEAKTVQVPFSILHHYVQIPHFHVYLERQTSCWKSEK